MSRVRISFPAPFFLRVFGNFAFNAKKRCHSQVVRQRSAKPLRPGSNPGGTSIIADQKICKAQKTPSISEFFVAENANKKIDAQPESHASFFMQKF